MINGYELSRKWWDFSFNNNDVKPIHSAIYLFAVEQCNRLGWKEKFSFRTDIAMESTGIKSYRTYINALRDLVDWGFIDMVEKSKNQHTANVVALALEDKAHVKALDKALTKAHVKAHVKASTPIHKTKKQVNNETNKPINKDFDLHVFFENENFKSKWNDWIVYKKQQFKFVYKNESSINAALRKLENLSNGDSELAIEIIEQSLAGGWKGFFKIKNQKPKLININQRNEYNAKEIEDSFLNYLDATGNT